MPLIISLLAGCGVGLRTTPSTPPALTLKPTATYLPLSDVTNIPTEVPGTGSIIPTIELAPNSPYTSAGHLRWFLEKQTILAKMNGITLIDPDTGATMKLEEDPATWFPNSIVNTPLSPNRKWIVYAVGDQELVLLDTSTTDKRFYHFPGEIGSLAWMPDNRHLLLSISKPQPRSFGGLESLPVWLFYFDIETNAYTILQETSIYQILDVSPDGESFLYFNQSSHEDLMLGFVSENPPVQLTDDTLYKYWADLALDGKALAVFATAPISPADPPILITPDYCSWTPYKEVHEVYVTNIGTKERRNYSVVGKVAYIRLSPDGSKIAFVKAEGSECLGNFPIHILDLESGVEETLEIRGFDLAWSPDGSKLVFTQFSPEFQYRRRIVIYDLTSHQIIATYYIEDLIWVVGESATPYWVSLKDINPP